MKITVKDCLAFEVLKSARLIAGEKGLGNRVKGVSVIDASEISDVENFLAQKGEMVLTGFFGMKEDTEKQTRFVEALADAGSAALVVLYLGSSITHLSKEVVDAAETG